MCMFNLAVLLSLFFFSRKAISESVVCFTVNGILASRKSGAHTCVNMSIDVYAHLCGFIHSSTPLCYYMRTSAALKSRGSPRPDSAGHSAVLKESYMPPRSIAILKGKTTTSSERGQEVRETLLLMLWLQPQSTEGTLWGVHALSLSDLGECVPHLLLSYNSCKWH